MPTIKDLAEGSSTQRGGLNHQAIEDYLKTIYALSKEACPVSTTRLAHARNVKPASATGMIRRLAKLSLVNYEKHRGVTLTDAGEKIALEVIRHHRLIELYLIRALGFTWDEVHEQADILEHVISEKLEDRIAAALGYPEFDPHGAPIPSKSGVIVERVLRPLTALKVGDTAQVSRIIDDSDGALLRYLAEQNLRIGAQVLVLDAAPFDGPLTLQVDSNKQMVGFRAASSILVSD
ncbi:MAG: metal-dependent transcriptional regulator [Candidatus Promineifilaceae bacterium]